MLETLESLVDGWSRILDVKRATLKDLDEVSRLFDLYRQFYEQPADLDRARGYIEARLRNDESIIYFATDDEGRGLGFTQLYATFCSVAELTFGGSDIFVRVSMIGSAGPPQ